MLGGLYRLRRGDYRGERKGAGEERGEERGPMGGRGNFLRDLPSNY